MVKSDKLNYYSPVMIELSFDKSCFFDKRDWDSLNLDIILTEPETALP